jgi:mannosidase alpha-like ER degradation enhancer 1
MHRDPNPGNFGVNDIHANVSMTLLDTLSSLPLIHPEAFPEALQRVATEISFDQDVKVQVFEMTIRAMGSLLSTYEHLGRIRADKDEGGLRRYQPRLLELALDLGKRLAPAFTTTTGLPYARVNLRHGVEKGESIETCKLFIAYLDTLIADIYRYCWSRKSDSGIRGSHPLDR